VLFAAAITSLNLPLQILLLAWRLVCCIHRNSRSFRSSSIYIFRFGEYFRHHIWIFLGWFDLSTLQNVGRQNWRQFLLNRFLLEISLCEYVWPLSMSFDFYWLQYGTTFGRVPSSKDLNFLPVQMTLNSWLVDGPYHSLWWLLIGKFSPCRCI